MQRYLIHAVDLEECHLGRMFLILYALSVSTHMLTRVLLTAVFILHTLNKRMYLCPD